MSCVEWLPPNNSEGFDISRDYKRQSPPTARAEALRWEAIAMLSWMLPKPYNYISAMGRGFRKLRLEKELAAFDFLCRLRCGQAASFDQLYCAGMLLISSHEGALSTRGLHLQAPLEINLQSFEVLLKRVEDKLQELDER